MDEDKKPFNDAIDHMNKIEGNDANLGNADLEKFPRPLRYIGYLIIGFFLISILLMSILSFIL